MAGKGSWLRQLQNILNSFDSTEFWTNHAIKTIKAEFGDVVSAEFKRKSLLKFGMNVNIAADVESSVAELPVAQEVMLDENLIDSLVCTDPLFDGDIYIEGQKIVDGNLIFVTQTITANGHTIAPLDTPLVIATRCENADETLYADLDDIVFIFEDGGTNMGVPDVDDTVHLTMSAAHRQSLRAGTAFSSIDYGLITHIYGDMNKDTPAPANADILLKVREIGEGQGRRPGGFKTKLIRTVSNTSTLSLDFEPKPFIIIPKNSIVLLNVVSTATGVSLSAGFNTVLARVQE